MGLFDVFAHPYPIRLIVPQTAGYDAQDEWQASGGSTTVIQGHLSVFTRADAESQFARRNPGVIEEGNPRLASYTYCPKGSIIEVERTATLGEHVDRYRVTATVKQQTLMSKMTADAPRWEMALAEEPANALA